MQPEKKVPVIREPQLETTKKIEVDPDTGLEIPTTLYRRGILAEKTTEYNEHNIAAFKGHDPARVGFESYCEDLRDELEALGLPSDRTPQWVRTDSGEYRKPLNDNERTSCLWTYVANEKTERLSRGRNAAELLFALTQLLKRKGIDDHLWHISQVMGAYYKYRVSFSINHLAVAGRKNARARANGPQAQKEAAQKRQNITQEIARDYWKRHPHYRGDASNTAAQIQAEVNARLKAENLLGKKAQPRSIRTLAGYISGMNGPVLQK